MNSYGDKLYIEIIEINKLYNFVVQIISFEAILVLK